MLFLEPPEQEIAARLAQEQRRSGVEQLLGRGRAGRAYAGHGEPDHVAASPELEAAYDDVDAKLCYYHSHPDERALSPTALRLLTREGVRGVLCSARIEGACLIVPYNTPAELQL